MDLEALLFMEVKGEVWDIVAVNTYIRRYCSLHRPLNWTPSLNSATPSVPCRTSCSTLIENTQGNSVSEDFSVRTWPWDMGNGIPINCAWWVGWDTWLLLLMLPCRGCTCPAARLPTCSADPPTPCKPITCTLVVRNPCGTQTIHCRRQ